MAELVCESGSFQIIGTDTSLLSAASIFGNYSKTNIVQPEVFGLNVLRESFGFKVGSEVMGFTVNPEIMGMNANKLITGTDEADSYWLFDDGGFILMDDGEAINVG